MCRIELRLKTRLPEYPEASCRHQHKPLPSATDALTQLAAEAEGETGA